MHFSSLKKNNKLFLVRNKNVEKSKYEVAFCNNPCVMHIAYFENFSKM